MAITYADLEREAYAHAELRRSGFAAGEFSARELQRFHVFSNMEAVRKMRTRQPDTLYQANLPIPNCAKHLDAFLDRTAEKWQSEHPDAAAEAAHALTLYSRMLSKRSMNKEQYEFLMQIANGAPILYNERGEILKLGH